MARARRATARRHKRAPARDPSMADAATGALMTSTGAGARRLTAIARQRRLVLGMVNGVLVAFLRVPSIVATLGTLSVFRGIDYFIAGSHQVPLASLPDGFTDPARWDVFGLPVFVLLTVGLVAIGSVILRST